MKKLALMAVGIVASVMAFASPVLADSPGQLSNGATNYKVRNVTQNIPKDDYTTGALSAACNDVVKYSITVANSDYCMLKDVNVKANLASGDVNISATNTVGATTSVSGKVTVNAAGTLQYVSGSTVRRTGDTAQTPTSKPDGITTANGVNVGDLNGSTYIRVQFQAKVSCAAPKTIKVCELSTKKIITINESAFDSSKHTTDLSKCAETPVTPPVTPPAQLPNTGAGNVIGLFAAVTVVGAIVHRLFVRRALRG